MSDADGSFFDPTLSSLLKQRQAEDHRVGLRLGEIQRVDYERAVCDISWYDGGISRYVPISYAFCGPSSFMGIMPEDGALTVDVEVVAPEDPETEFTGEVKVVNSFDPDDFCTIDVSLATPVSLPSLQSQALSYEVNTYDGTAPLSRDVVWDNGMNYEGLFAAQYDDASFDPLPADDFIFESPTLVNDVHWLGGYWNGYPAPFDFEVILLSVQWYYRFPRRLRLRLSQGRLLLKS